MTSSTLILIALYVTLTFQLYLDGNNDKIRQADEIGAGNVEYVITWTTGDLSSTRIGNADSNGYIQAEGEGDLLLETRCGDYALAAGDVAGAAVIDLACAVYGNNLFLPMIGR